MVVIPATPGSDSSWTERVTLDGTDYLLTFDWQARAGTWRLEIADQDEGLITVCKLVSEFPLLRRVVDPRRPPGELVVIDTLSQGADPTFTSLGDRHLVVYASPGEF